MKVVHPSPDVNSSTVFVTVHDSNDSANGNVKDMSQKRNSLSDKDHTNTTQAPRGI